MDSAMNYAVLAAAAIGPLAITICAVLEHRDAQIKKRKEALQKKLMYAMTYGSSGPAAMKMARPSGLTQKEEARVLQSVEGLLWDVSRLEVDPTSKLLRKARDTQMNLVRTPAQQNPGYQPCYKGTDGRGMNSGSVGEVDYIAASQMRRTEVASREKKALYEAPLNCRTGSLTDTRSRSESGSTDALPPISEAALTRSCGEASSRYSHSGCSRDTSGASSGCDSSSYSSGD